MWCEVCVCVVRAWCVCVRCEVCVCGVCECSACMVCVCEVCGVCVGWGNINILNCPIVFGRLVKMCSLE